MSLFPTQAFGQVGGWFQKHENQQVFTALAKGRNTLLA